MPKQFQVNRAYEPKLDVRGEDSTLCDAITKEPPGGKVWLLVAPRRGRKTWTLRGLVRQLGPSRATWLDLHGEDGIHNVPEKTKKRGYYYLLDEPHAILKKPNLGQMLVERCAALHDQGARAVLAVTPAECQLLLTYGKATGFVSEKAILGIPLLNSDEANQLASRLPAAQAMLGRLPPAWRNNAFRLELLFDQLERQPVGSPTSSPHSLIRAALDACRVGTVNYLHHAFFEGLSPEQQTLVRHVVRGEPVSQKDAFLLMEAGIIGHDSDTRRFFIGDPILAAEFSPLRIHHISDVHVGPKSAQSIDGKDGGKIAIAADIGNVRDSYVQHLAQLRAEGNAPHLVVISGDLTEYATDEQLTEAKAWVEKLREQLAAHPLLDDSAHRVLLVGGNHDVNWELTLGSDPQSRHRPFATAFADFPRPALEDPPESRSLATVYYPDFELEFLLLGSAELGGQIDQAHERHLLLLELAALADPKTEEERKRALKLELQAARDDPGLVHEQDLRRANAHSFRGKVRIAVLHHPVSALPTITEIARYAGLLNAGAVKDLLLRLNFSLVLHGHTHSAWFGIERWPGLHQDRPLHIASAPSLSSREVSENHGYNTIEINRDFDENGHRVFDLSVRRISRKGQLNWEESAKMPPVEIKGGH
ncbi:MAG: metallophosphoesterase [Myxococcales bacterium]|nr:metallophosphoesterase [Myxococcales bacterium]